MPEIICDNCGESTQGGRLKRTDFTWIKKSEKDLWHKTICKDCKDWFEVSFDEWTDTGLDRFDQAEAANAFWHFDPEKHFYDCCDENVDWAPREIDKFEWVEGGIRISYTCPNCLHSYTEFLHSEIIKNKGGFIIYKIKPENIDY